jgi:hypothetical protein
MQEPSAFIQQMQFLRMEETGFSGTSIPVFEIVRRLESDLASFVVSSAVSLNFPLFWDTTLSGWITAYRLCGRKQFPHLEWLQ